MDSVLQGCFWHFMIFSKTSNRECSGKNGTTEKAVAVCHCVVGMYIQVNIHVHVSWVPRLQIPKWLERYILE